MLMIRLLRDIIDTLKRNTETSIDASEVVGLEVNAEKTKYVSSSECRTMPWHKDSKVNVRYHSIQDLLSSHIMSKSVKIRFYKTIIILVIMYECKTWSLKFRGKIRLRVFENRVLRAGQAM
jgi:hypothetical protein